jgi:SagB-type dehydrogenase family enzyme
MSVVGDDFQNKTKYQRNKMSGAALDWLSQPKLYKEYPGSIKIRLPLAISNSNLSLHEVLQKRKSVRDFKSAPMSQESLSYLLWASTGISRRERGYEFRTAPSAGALYPIETYISVGNVTGINAGIYHYAIQSHALELIKKGDCSVAVANAALDQRMCIEASVVFIWTAIFERSKWKYGQRAYRYIYLDAGHIAENLALAVVSIGMGSCPIAALYDEEVNEIVGVDGEAESVIYMSVVG